MALNISTIILQLRYAFLLELLQAFNLLLLGRAENRFNDIVSVYWYFLLCLAAMYCFHGYVLAGTILFFSGHL